MEQRLSTIALRVTGIARAERFYSAMGWQKSRLSRDDALLFNANGIVLNIVRRRVSGRVAPVTATPEEQLAEAAVILVYVVRPEEDVTSILQLAEASGGIILKAVEGHLGKPESGYFSDPDGHIWEVARTTRTQVGADGSFQLAS